MSRDIAMPWCDWCQSYHSSKAEHISKQRWMAMVPGFERLFLTQGVAKKNSGGFPVKKVEVKPV